MTNEVEAQYDRLSGAFAKWTPSRRFQHTVELSVIAWLKAAPDRELRLLEAGCGHGTWIKKLLADFPPPRHRLSILGIDLSSERLALAKQQLGDVPAVSLQQGDLARTALPHDLDLIYTLEVFQHISPEEQGRLLQRWFHALTSGGAVVIVDKEFFSWHSFRVELEKLDSGLIRRAMRGRVLFPGEYLALAKTIRYPSFRYLRHRALALGYRCDPLIQVEEFRALVLKKP
jgi:trans-aconitate methyltransferase